MISLPLTLPMAAGLVYAWNASTIEGKVIIFLLVIGSAFSWSVMATKFVFVRQARRDNRLFLRRYRDSRHPLELFEKQAPFGASPLAAVYQNGCRELSFHLLGSSVVDETYSARLIGAPKIDATSMTSVRSALERAVGEESLKLESNLILLATAVSGAPFLGLLGTVWGVMDAFGDVALAGKANLAALAPGVSAALITTVAGLLVAIPAMFGYNFLITTLKGMMVEMENFAAECASDFEHKHLSRRS
ncbi:MAG: MotA/TolQ/ExbB proton channel family protein [Candidatus Methylacidiphilales bacterium]|nr:MotA/TolQ/ExbB proton channel family protein [Candidatus Methylacidiphilales bacterium]